MKKYYKIAQLDKILKERIEQKILKIFKIWNSQKIKCRKISAAISEIASIK